MKQTAKIVYHNKLSYQKSYFTYLWADVVKNAITAGTLACQEILITGAREASERTEAIKCTHVHMQRPHMVTDYIAIYWKINKN